MGNGFSRKTSYQVKRKIKKKLLDELPDCEMTEGLAPQKEVSYNYKLPPAYKLQLQDIFSKD